MENSSHSFVCGTPLEILSPANGTGTEWGVGAAFGSLQLLDGQGEADEEEGADKEGKSLYKAGQRHSFLTGSA